MNYKNLRDFEAKSDMRDNDSGHFTQKCPVCKSVEMQIDARHDRGRCHNRHCDIYRKWLSINEIYNLCRRLL